MTSPFSMVLPDYSATIKELERMSRQSLAESVIKSRVATQLRLLNIPPMYQGKTISDYKIESHSQKITFDRMVNFYSNFRENLKSHRNAMFLGNFGTGKTMLAYLFAQNIINQGYRVKYQKFDDIISDVRKTWGKSEVETEDVIKSFSYPDLLIIDEFGRSKITDDKIETFSKIFDWRYEYKKPVLLIANFKAGDIEAMLGARLWSRFEQNQAEIFAFTWSDYRLKIPNQK